MRFWGGKLRFFGGKGFEPIIRNNQIFCNFGTDQTFLNEKIKGTMLSVSEVAAKLKLSAQQVRNLCRNGHLKSDKIGRAWIIHEEDLEEFCASSFHGVAENQAPYEVKRKRSDKPIALSFFSGAMGMDIGLEKAGFEVVLASEIDNACRKTILRNHPDIALIGDIRNYYPEEIKGLAGLDPEDDIDLVVGGPPCQAFSTAGKRKAFEDERGNVFLNFINVIAHLRPKYAVIENVRGLLSAPLKHRPHAQRNGEELTSDELPGGALNHILKTLKSEGYEISFNLYNSANFGTPQKRERVVIVCSRDGKKPPYLEPTHSETGAYGLPKWQTFREAVAELSETEHDFVKFPEKRLKYYRLLKAGQNWRGLPEDLQKEAMGASYYSGGGKTGFLRRLAWDKPSPTLVTHPAMPATDLAHPEEDRPLSIQEYKKVQEFPDDWEIEGSLLEKYKQIGNAVPVGLGFAIGKLLMKLLHQEMVDQYHGFRYSRYKNTSDAEWEENFTAVRNQLKEKATA